MKIDWAALGLVSVVTVLAAVAVVGVVSLGLAALAASDDHAAAGRRTAPLKAVAGLCFALGAAFVLFGLYLIIPQFR